MRQNLPHRVVLGPHVVWHQLEDEIVLLNLTTEQYHGLNEVGSDALKLLIETGDPEHVVNQILVEYEIDEESVRRDLADLLSELVAAQLIDVTE